MKPPVLTGIDRLRLTITVRNMRLLTYIEPNISILLTQEDGAERPRLLLVYVMMFLFRSLSPNPLYSILPASTILAAIPATVASSAPFNV